MQAMDWPALVKAITGRLMISQVELAERCGVAQQTVSAWKRGRRVPSLYARRKLRDLATEAGVPFPASEATGMPASDMESAEAAGEWPVASPVLRELIAVARKLPDAVLREVLDFARFKATGGGTLK